MKKEKNVESHQQQAKKKYKIYSHFSLFEVVLHIKSILFNTAQWQFTFFSSRFDSEKEKEQPQQQTTTID